MGVPKFFRYISERYPCLSEILKEYQIPEFDNLYLDMNGIIHTCSHPKDADIEFRISEKEIFQKIFHYIEILFRMIQPKKLFFLAVDGVAPRAKINQQRGRRFRAAKEAEILKAKAEAKGMIIPPETIFDSNCITPGTLFMANLNEQLKYFITYKISTDKLWRKCKVLFSGSEVPGEGEHKIMDYIRYMKAQPDYDPHTRHCLYGLDADLIMLGLCTHEPHFSLLREEVKFGKKQKKILTPEETRFCLLRLSLLRDYIEHEFSVLKDTLPFPFSIERIIDDWVLMGFLVGNDFIPHLPNLHIANGALPVLYRAYMEVLPTLEGYINEAGTLKLDRFEKFMERLSRLDIEQFTEYYADLKYLENKIGRPMNEVTRHAYKKNNETSDDNGSPRRFRQNDLDALIMSTNMSLLHSDDDDENEDDDEIQDNESDTEMYNMEFVQHKRDYYMNKLEYENVDAEVLRSQAEGYVRAIQWNLHYYYNGCCSWSWYYPHHYAPYISDIKDFKNLKLEFELGEPFLPFQQLLAVLPARSKDLLPSAFQSLLTEEQSPIIDYYPVEFKTDLNGKRQEWEAVVLIPFIDEKSLLRAMEPHCSKLTLEEQKRNQHGPMCLYSYAEENFGTCSAPRYFPDITSHAKVELIQRDDIVVPSGKLIKGLHPRVKMGVYFPGFPTLQYIKHSATLQKAKVKVFEQPSRGENMILQVLPQDTPSIRGLALDLLGKSVYVGWPHLLEAQVIGISDTKLRISLIDPQQGYTSANVNEEEVKGPLLSQWNLQKKHIADMYKGRHGIDIGETNILIHARPFLGNKYIFGAQGKVYTEKQWNMLTVTYAYQTIVKDISVFCSDLVPYKSVSEIFTMGSTCFMLGHPHYGAMLEVIEPGINTKAGRIKVSVKVTSEPALDTIKQAYIDQRTQYMHGSIAAQRLGISSHLLSRITGTIYVVRGLDTQQDVNKHNVGLNLKFNKKNEEVPGYTRKDNGQWLYSTKAVELIRNYMAKCPDLFERLAKNVTNDIFHEDELFDKNSTDLTDILDWLKAQEYRSLESRPCGSNVLDVDIIQKLEAEIDEFSKTQHQLNKLVLMQVKPHLLFKPGLHLKNSPPDPKAHHRLLDRICCVRDSFTVPLGSKGTIIGLQNAENVADCMYDIVFDNPFPGGLPLNGCSANRGYRLSASDFINISYGEKVEHGRTNTTDVNLEASDPRKRMANLKSQVSANLGTSITKEQPEMPIQVRIMKKTDPIPQFRSSSPRNTSMQKQKLSCRSSPLQESVASATPNSLQDTQKEIHAVWNDLLKLQKSSEVPEKASTSYSGAKANQVSAENASNPHQDPSAFLKAILKISDETTPSAITSSSTTTTTITAAQHMEKHSEAPPLVQQLFDHARQSGQKSEDKSPIWYCSQLLKHFQLSGKGMPRYSYAVDQHTNLIRAQIFLPDTRLYTGDFCATHALAAESVAKKVYTELNLDKVVKPDAKVLMPPPLQWYNSQQNNTWAQNMRPPMMPMCPIKNIPPSPQNAMPFYPQWNHNSQPNIPFTPPASTIPGQLSNRGIPDQAQPHKAPKSEIKSTTPFVPLQAQKKSRNIVKHQQATKEDQHSKNSGPPVTQKAKEQQVVPKVSNAESLTKTTVKPTTSTTQNSPKPHSTNRPRRSRVAAKFGAPAVTNGNDTQ